MFNALEYTELCVCANKAMYFYTVNHLQVQKVFVMIFHYENFGYDIDHNSKVKNQDTIIFVFMQG